VSIAVRSILRRGVSDERADILNMNRLNVA